MKKAELELTKLIVDASSTELSQNVAKLVLDMALLTTFLSGAESYCKTAVETTEKLYSAALEKDRVVLQSFLENLRLVTTLIKEAWFTTATDYTETFGALSAPCECISLSYTKALINFLSKKEVQENVINCGLDAYQLKREFDNK